MELRARLICLETVDKKRGEIGIPTKWLLPMTKFVLEYGANGYAVNKCCVTKHNLNYNVLPLMLNPFKSTIILEANKHRLSTTLHCELSKEANRSNYAFSIKNSSFLSASLPKFRLLT